LEGIGEEAEQKAADSVGEKIEEEHSVEGGQEVIVIY